MTTLLHVADRVLNRPLLISPDKAQVILSVLAGRLGVNSPEASQFEGESWGKDGRERPYRVTEDGIAIISILGSLVNRGAWVGASSGLTSYEGIGHQVKSAMADAAVKAVILDMETPGGEAVGAFEVADLVRQLAAVKRTVAVVNGMAASAGYAIASGAGEIVTTETGVSGSIGVVMLHADFSKQLEAKGVDPTLIFAGAHKVDGNMFEPLPEAVRADMQAEVTSFYDLFVKTVAKGRGARLTAAAARKTEARVFIGQAAVMAGLADRVGTFDGVLAELSASQKKAVSTYERKRAAGGSAGLSSAGPVASPDTSEEAERQAYADGFAAETRRWKAAMLAPGIAGNGERMVASMDLLTRQPKMAGADIANFVLAHLHHGAADGAAAYEAMRLAAQPPLGKTIRCDE